MIDRKRASKYDPLRPSADLSNIRPHYEDRVLVRWIPPPAAPSIIATPHRPSVRDTGPQHGIVVAVGRGNTGLTKVVVSPNGGPMMKHKPYKGGTRTPCTVQSGDHVIYSRVEDQEFMQDGDLFTFLFEEQHILGVLIDGSLPIDQVLAYKPTLFVRRYSADEVVHAFGDVGGNIA